MSKAVAGTCEACGPRPLLVPFPPGFAPEGIAKGTGDTFYAGSTGGTTQGQILAGDLSTGHLSELVAPTSRPAIGMKYDPRSNLLFVATRGPAAGLVYDGTSGAKVAEYEFDLPDAAVNDVGLRTEGAYFTNSSAAAGAFLYRVALGPDGQPGLGSRIDLPASFSAPGSCTAGPPLTGNGIVATEDGRYVILVHMSEGSLYRLSLVTQQVESIALPGGDVCTSDGLLIAGSTLYAVQNFLNRVAVVDMAPDYLSGTVNRHITEPFASRQGLRVPATIADFRDYLYAVTAGFAPPARDFAVRLDK